MCYAISSYTGTIWMNSLDAIMFMLFSNVRNILLFILLAISVKKWMTKEISFS